MTDNATAQAPKKASLPEGLALAKLFYAAAKKFEERRDIVEAFLFASASLWIVDAGIELGEHRAERRAAVDAVVETDNREEVARVEQPHGLDDIYFGTGEEKSE